MPEELKKAFELISANKEKEEVKSELKKLHGTPTVEDAFALLQGDENGTKLLESYADKRVSSGVNSALENFKKKEVPKLLQEAIKTKEAELEAKYNPQMSPLEKEAVALKTRVAELERTNKITDTTATLTKLFVTKNVDPTFVDLFVSEDKDEAIKKAENFADFFTKKVNETVNVQVESLLKQHGYDPNQTKKAPQAGKVTQQQIEKAADDARRLGTAESRAAYSLLKQEFELQQQQTE